MFASGADLQSINPLLTVHPLARQVQRYVLLTTLVQYDSSVRVAPYLARRWNWSADSMTITFHLANAVRWHDGAPTTARDVAWTIDAARDPATGYPRQSDLTDVVGVTAPDDSTVTVAFSHKKSAIPDVFTDLGVLPAHLLGNMQHASLRTAAWNQVPVGNGPYRFVSHTPNRRWVFAANPDFPVELGGPPHIDRLVIAVVDEPTTKLAALTSGELDFAGINPAHASFVQRDTQLAVIQYPLLYTYALAFNTRRPPFNDIGIRRAISAALDRSAIVNGYLFGYATPATGPIVGMPTDSTQSAPDLAAARSLLGTRHVAFELLTVGSGEAALEQMIQNQLAAVGVTVTIRQLELTTYLDRVQGPSHNFEAAVMGSAGDLDLGQLAPMLRITGINSDGNRAAQLQRTIDSVPAAFLYHARGVQGMNRRVTGVHMDVRGELATLYNWRVVH